MCFLPASQDVSIFPTLNFHYVPILLVIFCSQYLFVLFPLTVLLRFITNKNFIKTNDLMKHIQTKSKQLLTLYLPLRSINIITFFTFHLIIDLSESRNPFFFTCPLSYLILFRTNVWIK